MHDTYESFKSEVLKLTGINLDFYKERQMKRRINSLKAKRGYADSYLQYFSALKKDPEMLQEFINFITINVSEFFRNPSQWQVLEDIVLPYLIKHMGSQLSIWSAACSTGQEPYTLAMILSKMIPLQKIKIIATDIDAHVLKKAKQGIYDEKTIEGISQTNKEKFLIKKEGQYLVKDELKKCIQFKKHDLLKDTYPGNLDLIVCRNVLIYFTEAAKDKIYQKFNDSLKKDGVLFVGSTEQIINAKQYNFTSMKTFFYQKE